IFQTYAFGNCTVQVYWFDKFYLPAIYSMLFLVCFPGNIIVISIYIFKMRPWKSSTIIMLNLAITDLLYICCLPFLIHYSASGDNWIFGDFMCKFIRFSFYFNMYSSILFLTCFSIFRFVVVVYPMNCFLVQKRRWAVLDCAAVWVISLLVVSPMAFLITTKHKQNRCLCLGLTASDNEDAVRLFNWLLTGLAFLLPLVVVTLCYTYIIYTLASGPQTHTAYKHKARKLAILLLAVFYVCFLPFHIFRAVWIEIKFHPVSSCYVQNQINSVFVVTKSLAALNTIGNLLLYVVLGDNFQQAILSVFKLKIKKNVK
uniref:Oxoglutarate receptor 1 n=1 Tax=Sphenodon punctatus TaxID=8508 RepID=A0A8D0GXT4_SPHPU